MGTISIEDGKKVVASIKSKYSDVNTNIASCKSSIEASYSQIPNVIQGNLSASYNEIQSALDNLLDVCSNLDDATVNSINAYFNIENEDSTSSTLANITTLGNLKLNYGIYGLTVANNVSKSIRMGEDFFRDLASKGVGTYDEKKGMYEFHAQDGKVYRYDAVNGIFYYNNKKMPIGLFYPEGHGDLSTCNTVTFFGGYHLDLGRGVKADRGFFHSYEDGTRSFVLDRISHSGTYTYLNTKTDAISIVPQTPYNNQGRVYGGEYMDLTSACLDFVTEVVGQKSDCHNVALGISGGGDVAATFAMRNDRVDTIAMVNGCITNSTYNYEALKNKKIIMFSSKADDLRLGKATHKNKTRYDNSSISTLYHLLEDGHSDVTFYTSNSDIASQEGWSKMMSTTYRHTPNNVECYYRPSKYIPSQYNDNLTSGMTFTSVGANNYQEILTDSNNHVNIVYLGDDYQESFIKQANIMGFVMNSDMMATLSANQYNVN